MLILIQLLVLSFLNVAVFLTSPHIDTFQFIEDLSIFSKTIQVKIFTTYILVSFFVALATVTLIILFKPFIEVYLLHYARYLFYLIVCLLGLSTVYIVLRVYGYSRFSLLIYLLFSSLFLHHSGNILNLFKRNS